MERICKSHKQVTGPQTVSELLITCRNVMNGLGFKKYFQCICLKTKNNFETRTFAKINKGWNKERKGSKMQKKGKQMENKTKGMMR